MMVLRMKACPQHSTGKEGVTISLRMLSSINAILPSSRSRSCWFSQAGISSNWPRCFAVASPNMRIFIRVVLGSSG
ncbi:hypothetical protein CD34_00655 [Salmonella enterica subsp. enterica serovar Typhimurium]|nr:hypothetical protein [Salmonella enterica subsp. enterica serovar Typhimurium]